MWAVRFEEVSKRYRKGGQKYSSIGTELTHFLRRMRSRAMGHTPELTGTPALDRVSFEIEEGESFALIGSNGAGKTTALRLLARISPPTGGRVRVRGRVGALMEVGSGVHVELTGRENIWLYGSILGIPRAEIRRRFDEIVGFAELEEALDTQVKYYSSGMQLRLGFSIASHLEPDVFIVDEALSVGDVTFQERCVERMHKLVRQGTTVLYVSHNLSSVESLCDRAILIDNGRPVTQGPTKEVLTHYLAMLQNRRVDLRGLETNAGTVRIASATTHTPDGRETRVFGSHQPIELRLRFECDRPIQRPLVRVTVTDGRPGTLIECSMLDDGDAPAWVGTEWECRLLIGELPLRPRVYQVSVDVSEESGHAELMRTLEVATFQVIAPMRDGLNSVVTAAMAGAIDVPYQWDVRT